jgi:hypothetical protein
MPLVALRFRQNICVHWERGGATEHPDRFPIKELSCGPLQCVHLRLANLPLFPPCFCGSRISPQTKG